MFRSVKEPIKNKIALLFYSFLVTFERSTIKKTHFKNHEKIYFAC